MTVLTHRKLGGRAWLANPPASHSWDALTPYSQVALGFMNATATALTGGSTSAFVTTNHRAQRGDIPAGYSLGLFEANGTAITTQQDNEAPAWADGSFSSGTLSAILPDTLAANGSTGDTASYFVKPVAGSPNRTPKFTLAAWAAANDLKLIFRTNLANLSDDTSNYQVRVADIVAAGLYEGSSSGSDYPLTSIRVDRSGPVCMGWRFRGYARRISDGAWHQTLKGEIYVTAISLTDMLIDSMLEQKTGVNTGGVWNAAQTIGPGTSDNLAPMVGIAELWNGSTKLHSWGGPTDYRTTTFAAGSVDLTNNMIDWPTTSGVQRCRNEVPYVFQSTGTLPGGLQPNTPYYPGANFSSIGLNKALIFTRRCFPNGNGMDQWAANTAVSEWQYDGYYVGSTGSAGPLLGQAFYNTQMYYAAQGGTTGSTPPSGTAPNQTDGSVIWSPLNILLTSTGSGTLSAYPCVHVFPGCAAPLIDEQTTDPIWTGSGPAPRMEPQKDTLYFSRYARAIPPYDLTITPFNDSLTFDGFSVCEPYVAQDIDNFGDNPGDNLIGWLSVTAANALLRQRNVTAQRATRAEAFGWVDHPTFCEDPRSMQPVVGLAGPGNVSGRYSGLGPSIFDFHYNTNYTGTGKFVGGGRPQNGNWYSFRYATPTSGAHQPAFWALPYERTGRTIFLDMGIELGNCCNLGADDGNGSRVLTAGGITYSATWLVNGQPRGCGWNTRAIGVADDVLPATHPMRPYLTDVINNGLACAVAVIADNQANWPGSYVTGRLRWGWPQQYSPNTGSTNMKLWMISILLLCVAQEARKGRYAGWRTYAEHIAQNFWRQICDSDLGGCEGNLGWMEPEYWIMNQWVANPAPTIGTVYTITPNSNFAAPGSKPAAFTYTVTSTDPTVVAQGIVAAINGNAGAQAWGLQATYDGTVFFHVRCPAGLFNPNSDHADAWVEFNSGDIALQNGSVSSWSFAVPKQDTSVLREFTSWNECRAYNLCDGWATLNKGTQEIMAGTEIAQFSVSGWFPWGTTGYTAIGLAALATMAEAGITNASAMYSRAWARAKATNSGVNFSGTTNAPSITGGATITATWNNFALRTFADQTSSNLD